MWGYIINIKIAPIIKIYLHSLKKTIVSGKVNVSGGFGPSIVGRVVGGGIVPVVSNEQFSPLLDWGAKLEIFSFFNSNFFDFIPFWF